MESRWVTQIDKLFIEHGLELLCYQRLPIKDEIKKPWTDLQVTAAGEQIKNVIIPTCKEDEGPSAEKWLELLDGLIYEKNLGISGTWYENRYPGCACDIPAHNYVYSFEPKHDWSAVYASASEINGYFNDFSKKYKLNKYIKTAHEVYGASWTEQDSQWNIMVRDLDSGQPFKDSCDIFIHASGYLNKWKWPDIQGLRTFSGKMLHTARWDDTVDLNDKKVGLIGNGSSAIQILPKIQPVVNSLKMFIRSPAWVAPTIGTGQRTYSQQEISDFAENPGKLTAHRKASEITMNSLFSVYLNESRLQNRLKSRLVTEMKQTLQNEALEEKFIPKWGVGCQRITPCPGYLETIRKDNVTVVRSGVVELTEKGCLCADSNEHPIDVLICATGFDTSYRPRFPIIGPEGSNLQDAWANELTSYLGIAAAGFPNLCISSICGTKRADNMILSLLETQADHILHLIDRFQTENIHSFSPKHAAVTDFIVHTKSFMRKTVWSQPCTSTHKSKDVNATPILWPGSILHYMEALKELRADDWDIRYRGNRFAWLANGFSQAEFDPTNDLGYYVRDGDSSPYASRRKRRALLTRSGTQKARPLHTLHRPDPSEIVLESPTAKPCEEDSGGNGAKRRRRS
ncbi:MAG: hypothetical protein Q9187_001064 [Circinaria calcarea]